MNFKKMLSRSGDGLLQARANNIANTVRSKLFLNIKGLLYL